MAGDQAKSDYVFTSRRTALIFTAGALASIFVALAVAGNREVEVTALFNEIRKQNNLGEMSPDPRLKDAALYQAKRMAQYQKIGHSIGWGNDFASRLRKAGIHGAAAENVSSGQPDFRAAFKAWMNSKGHRRNMLDPDFSHYGFAWATSPKKPGYIYWALVLGR